MPGGLSALMGLESNRTPGGPNVAAYTPNVARNQARSSALSRMLGIGPADGSISQTDLEGAFDEQMGDQMDLMAADAEARALPARIAAEGDYEQEMLRGDNLRSVANINAEAANARAAESRASQEFLTRLRGDIQSGNRATADAATAARQAATAQATAGRSQLNDALMRRRKAIEAQQKVSGVWRMFGGGKAEDRAVADLDAQIKQLGQGIDTSGGFDPQQAAEAAAARNPGGSLAELLNSLQYDSPEEEAATAAALQALGYQ